MSSAFPTLSKLPKSVTITPVDNSIKVQPEDGPMMARKRYTKEIYTIEVEYPPLKSADVALLLDPITGFWLSVGTYNIFPWTWEGTTYNVRFQSPIKKTRAAATGSFSTINFTLQST